MANKEHDEQEEIYWFLKWVSMRIERNKLRAEINILKDLDIVKLHKENLQLKNNLEQIRNEFQPVKKIIHRKK